MKKISKKEIIIAVILLGLLLIYKLPKIFINKEIKLLPEVKLKEEAKTNNLFAIMIPKEDGDGYEEYKSENNAWPGDDYQFKEAKCIDINGNIVDDAVSFENVTKTVILETDKTVSCTIYFDKSILGILREKDTNKNLSEDIQGGMYRYQGLYTDNVRNYICLGEYCCNNEKCGADSNDYMYRIIGITPDGELKLIKKTPLTDTMQWHVNNTNIEWSNSNLFHQLNDYEEGTYKDTSFYSSLNDDLKKIIIKKDWMYGDTDNSAIFNGEKMYNLETGKINATVRIKNENDEEYTIQSILWSHTINTYIGLEYSHDYLLAYPGGDSQNNINAMKSWIFWLNNVNNIPSDTFEWTMSKYGYYLNNTYFARHITETGFVYGDRQDRKDYVRPVFYLKSDIKLLGEGTIDKPFIINK